MEASLNPLTAFSQLAINADWSLRHILHPLRCPSPEPPSRNRLFKRYKTCHNVALARGTHFGMGRILKPHNTMSAVQASTVPNVVINPLLFHADFAAPGS